MSIYRIAVCDDVDIERDILCTLLRQCDKQQVTFQFSSGEELLRSQENFDLIFLDIFMSGMTGMETAKALHERNSLTPIVFLTASPDFALESYEVHAFDYIVKPLQQKRLHEVWERFARQQKHKPGFLIIKDSVETTKLPYDQIEYLESCQHYVTIFLTNHTSLRTYGRLDDFEQQLNDARFLRCHKSYLINLSLTKAMGEDFLMYSGKQVPYRKREKKRLQSIFYNYMVAERSESVREN